MAGDKCFTRTSRYMPMPKPLEHPRVDAVRGQGVRSHGKVTGEPTKWQSDSAQAPNGGVKGAGRK